VYKKVTAAYLEAFSDSWKPEGSFSSVEGDIIHTEMAPEFKARLTQNLEKFREQKQKGENHKTK
jgi:hypothetical protein